MLYLIWQYVSISHTPNKISQVLSSWQVKLVVISRTQVLFTNLSNFNLMKTNLFTGNYLIDLIDEDKLLKHGFNKELLTKEGLIDENEESSLKDLLRNHKVFKLFEDTFNAQEIMLNLTYSHSEIIIDTEFLMKNGSFIGLASDRDCNIRTYNQLSDICFSISCAYHTMGRSKHNIFTDRSTLLKSSHKNTLLRLKLNQTILEQIKSPFVVFIFGSDTAFTYKAVTQTSISLNSDLARHYDITFQRFRNIRLEAPYTTKCMDYLKKGR